jgi:hypothetical protein
MLTLGISFLTKKEIPLVDDWIGQDDDEVNESIKRSIYVVEHNENLFNDDKFIEWSEYNPKIKRP